MIEIKEVLSKSDEKKFIEFPNILYKDNKYYVPPLMSDEKKLFSVDHPAYEQSEAVFYLAYDGDKVVGRIMGILQKTYNEKTGEKRVRFTRFDALDSQEIADKLFGAVENWAKSKGMNKIHGPLGFNDLDREGLLIKGFDQFCTFEEQYNYDYYQKLIENVGFIKETDWSERKVYPPDQVNPKLDALAERCIEKNQLKVPKFRNTKKLLGKYKDQIFDLIDECYSPLYGVVPITMRQRDLLVKQFNLLLKTDYIILVTNKDDKLIGFGFAMPSLSKALQPSQGRLFPFGVFRVLKAINKPRIMDFALVAVAPEYRSKGVAVIIAREMQRLMVKFKKVTHYETNLNLEDNEEIQNWWNLYKTELNKWRRSFIKKID